MTGSLVILLPVFIALGADASVLDRLRERWLLKVPVSSGMEELFSGEVRLNTVRGRFFMESSPDSAGAVRKDAERMGWRAVPGGSRILAGPSGPLAVGAYEYGRRNLLVALPEEGAGFAVFVLLEDRFMWDNGKGEAPCTEPAGVPRPPSSRRLLHLAAAGYEAAWYASVAPVAEALAEIRSALARRGWNVSAAGSCALSASRAGAPAVAVHVTGRGRGSCLLILSAGRRN